MKVAIMQPYFMPYLGYFQLINSVDTFVIYDNIQYTKKGWINRNRILEGNSDKLITVPIKSDSTYLDVIDREISDIWLKEKIKLLNRISITYKKAPYYQQVYKLIEDCINYDNLNLFKFIYNSIINLNSYMGITSKMVISSTIEIDHTLKLQDKVLAICKALKATKYINAIGGTHLYNKEIFKKHNLELNFIKSDNISYKQYGNDFIPYLSIIDTLMFNSQESIKEFLNSYTLI
jgi:hypothetical protein